MSGSPVSWEPGLSSNAARRVRDAGSEGVSTEDWISLGYDGGMSCASYTSISDSGMLCLQTLIPLLLPTLDLLQERIQVPLLPAPCDRFRFRPFLNSKCVSVSTSTVRSVINYLNCKIRRDPRKFSKSSKSALSTNSWSD